MYKVDELLKAITAGAQEVLPGEDALEKELQVLVDEANSSGQKIKHYIGFEISGQIHIGSGVLTAIKVAQLSKAGVECNILLADYHTWINNKLDGTIETCRKVARDYFGPVMLETMKAFGANMENVNLIYAQEAYDKKVNSLNFFDYDLAVAKNLTLSRVLKSISITGKKDGKEVSFGTLRYPPMQIADAFFLGTHIVHAGMDQRKAHVLMREVASKIPEEMKLSIGSKKVSPVVIHHPLVLGLGKPALDGTQERMRQEILEDAKMSKSKPDSAVFVHDSPEDIIRKLKKAYCPIIDTNLSPEENACLQEDNPILDWCQKIIYASGKNIELNRPEKFGGNKTYNTYHSLKQDYLTGSIHPLDLKNALGKKLIALLEPIYTYTQKESKGLKLIKGIINPK